MQLSMDPKFPGYRADAWELDITIWLDGIQQHRAVAIDTVAGVVHVHTPDHGYVAAHGKAEIRNHKGKLITKWT